MTDWRIEIQSSLGLEASSISWRPVSGGDIVATYQLSDQHRSCFVKTMPVGQEGLLAAESRGLLRLAESGTVRVPALLGNGTIRNTSWLALEWLELRPRSAEADRRLGRQLAHLHQVQGSRHGFESDNFIGLTPQRNDQKNDWVEFYARCRLLPQLEMMEELQQGWLDRAADLLQRLPALFDGYQPSPSLLHGDLWSGNAAMLPNGTPVIYDPACYYGDRETDLAMSELFGGFSPAFYQAYEQTWPLDRGYPRRKPLYKLYHIMNHANLFGGGYFQQARRILDDIASSLD